MRCCCAFWRDRVALLSPNSDAVMIRRLLYMPTCTSRKEGASPSPGRICFRHCWSSTNAKCMCPRYLAHKESTVDIRFGETPKATTSSTQPRMMNVNASTDVNDTGWISFPILTVALCPMDLRWEGKINSYSWGSWQFFLYAFAWDMKTNISLSFRDMCK